MPLGPNGLPLAGPNDYMVHLNDPSSTIHLNKKKKPEEPVDRRVVIALPGSSFSADFLLNMIETVSLLRKNRVEVALASGESSFVPFARMKTLGLNVLNGEDQKPFNGQYKYDTWITIDSDIRFTPQQVFELIESTDTHHVVAGAYRMKDLINSTAIKKWDTDYYLKNGTFKFIPMEELKYEAKYTPVEYSGMGFFACRHGVIEKMKYPYFHHPIVEMKDDNGKIIREMCSEDVAFCKNIKNAGFNIMLKTTLIVGHEKTLVI